MEILNRLQALGLLREDRQMARETNDMSMPTDKGWVRRCRSGVREDGRGAKVLVSVLG